jgi:hypothetical protein
LLIAQLSTQLHSRASALTHGDASAAAAAAAAAPPGYINVVIISFVKPECTYTKGSLSFAGTGLDFSSSGPVVKAAIAALKAATNNNTKVLLAVGGATYTNFAQMNTQCLADLVDDFGFDGVDIDFEVGVGGCYNTFITTVVMHKVTCAVIASGVPCWTRQARLTTALCKHQVAHAWRGPATCNSAAITGA